MSKVKTTKTKKATAKKVVKKAVGVRLNTNKVTLTLKQAQAIETLLGKAGKTSKVLSNKINAINA